MVDIVIVDGWPHSNNNYADGFISSSSLFIYIHVHLCAVIYCKTCADDDLKLPCALTVYE